MYAHAMPRAVVVEDYHDDSDTDESIVSDAEEEDYFQRGAQSSNQAWNESQTSHTKIKMPPADCCTILSITVGKFVNIIPIS